MYTVNDLSRRFGDTLLFEHVSFTINADDRIGLVGPNGSGKTTLLRTLMQEEPHDSGSLTLTHDKRLGYLRQGFSDVPEGMLTTLLGIPTGGLLARQQELADATTALANPEIDPVVVTERFEQASVRFAAFGGYQASDELETLLDRFGLGDIGLDRPLTELSGGQKTRAGLAALLTSRPDILIFDEPTNHLDADAIAWLTGFLSTYPGAVLVVSHDHAFLDDVVTQIFALDPVAYMLKILAGNYSDFSVARCHLEDEAEAAWHRQKVEVTRIKRDIRAAENKARTIEAGTIDYAIRKKAAKIAHPAVVRKRKLERMLDDDDVVEKPVRSWGMSLDFAGSAEGARDVVQMEGVSVALGEHTILRCVNLHLRHGEKLALMGPNGSGKTTLMRVITGDLVPDSGRVRIGSGVKVAISRRNSRRWSREGPCLSRRVWSPRCRRVICARSCINSFSAAIPCID